MTVQTNSTIQSLKLIVIILLVLTAACAVAFAVRQLRKGRLQKARYEKQIRTQILNQSLKNNMRREVIEPVRGTGTDEREREGRRMLRILFVKNGAEEAYILNPSEGIWVGTDGDCDIRLDWDGIGRRQFGFFTYQDNIYVKNRNLSEVVWLRRKNRRISIDDVGIRICTGDEIIIGRYYIRAELLDSVGRIAERR